MFTISNSKFVHTNKEFESGWLCPLRAHKKKRSLCLVVCLFTSYLSWFLQTSKNRQIMKTPKFSEPFFCLMLWMIWNYSLKLFCGFNQRKQFCWVFWHVLSFSWFLFKGKMWRFHEVSVSNCEKKSLALILLMLDYTDSVDGSTTQYIDVLDNYFLFFTFFWYFAVIYVNSFETCSHT